MARALYLGLKFDARLAALLVIPPLVAGRIPFLRAERPAGRVVWAAYLTLAGLLLLLAYLVDFGAYAYLHSRLNAMLLSFLGNPATSWRMVRETYPVVPLALLVLAAAVALAALHRRGLVAFARERGARLRLGWRRRAASMALLALVLAAAVYGRFSRFPLRWSEAFFSGDAFISASALNPVLFFADTLVSRRSTWEMEEVRARYPRLAALYGVAPPADGSVTLRREGIPRPRLSEETNVVIVLLETFAAFKTGALGNPLDPSPRFDALAREGLLFTRFFVPMENTSRSLFGILTGIPDVSTDRYASWNPLVIRQRTILNAFTGHDKLYFLGGSASWGNIRGILRHNIPGLEIYEEGSYAAPVQDVWGIADTDLFAEADRVLRRRTRPFVAVIQTSGNHRPFTIPRDARGFTPRQADPEELRRHGFYSPEEYNGFRFLDHSLGSFMDLARDAEWFRRTLFVILGDHGTNGGAVDRRFGEMALNPFHVPLLLYGPGLIAPGREDGLASSLDLLPTLASLLGRPYVNTGFGRDLFDPGRRGRRFAFTYALFQAVPRVGLLEDGYYATVDQEGTARLYLADAVPEEEVTAREPERARLMAGTALDILHLARYLMYHNGEDSGR
jgi:hypothetical protein